LSSLAVHNTINAVNNFGHMILDRLSLREGTRVLLVATNSHLKAMLMSEGASNKEIAAMLTVTSETVKSHVRNIFRKLDVDRRIKAVALAEKLNLLKGQERQNSYNCFLHCSCYIHGV